VLGYPRQNQTFPRKPLPPVKLGHSQPCDPDVIGPTWALNGSFLVYRRLRQDVPAFNRFLSQKAAELAKRPGFQGITGDALGALIVGRCKSGAPVMRAVAPEHTAELAVG
jgi:deferrochelatase/peroxidase EfeB